MTATVPVWSKLKIKEIPYCILRNSVKGFCYWYLVADRRTDVVSTQGVLVLLLLLLRKNA
jgi:hypothetical protein